MNMQQMMVQARKMQERLTDAQAHLKDIEVSASAGGGVVRVTANADMQLTSVTLDPAACDPADAELLQDAIMVAVNDALAAAQEAADQKMAAVTGAVNIPGLR